MIAIQVQMLGVVPVFILERGEVLTEHARVDICAVQASVLPRHELHGAVVRERALGAATPNCTHSAVTAIDGCIEGGVGQALLQVGVHRVEQALRGVAWRHMESEGGMDTGGGRQRTQRRGVV